MTGNLLNICTSEQIKQERCRLSMYPKIQVSKFSVRFQKTSRQKSLLKILSSLKLLKRLKLSIQSLLCTRFLAREWSRVVSLNRFKIYLIFIIFMYIFKIKKLAKKILKKIHLRELTLQSTQLVYTLNVFLETHTKQQLLVGKQQ